MRLQPSLASGSLRFPCPYATQDHGYPYPTVEIDENDGRTGKEAALTFNHLQVANIDGGNVWPTAPAFSVGSLRQAVGAGAQYQTPIGPVRFDFGYQLNPIAGLKVSGAPQARRWRMHFSIGHAF